MLKTILEDSLGFNIYRAELLFRREFLKALKSCNMTPEQWSVMTAVLDSDVPLSQKAIAQQVLKDKYTTSRIIQRLVRDGWLEKSGNAEDARAFDVKATDRGLRLRNEIPELLFNHFDPLLRPFNDTEVDTLITLLRKLRTVLGD